MRKGQLEILDIFFHWVRGKNPRLLVSQRYVVTIKGREGPLELPVASHNLALLPAPSSARALDSRDIFIAITRHSSIQHQVKIQRPYSKIDRLNFNSQIAIKKSISRRIQLRLAFSSSAFVLSVARY
ncbi:hypothetical protein VNO77_02979 [Canavalia gladiata]|uniref:Uncharacterized protein n=1 Tax=Canavalia gladiata TaxID=3824 RepID=A0AAN9MYX4_CANGL